MYLPPSRRLLLAGIVLLSMLGLARPAGAQSSLEEYVLESKITGVTVYFQGAEVRMQGTHKQLPAGTHRLIFRGLSPQIDENSLAVTGKGNGVIQSVTYRKNYLNRTPKNNRQQTLEDSLDLLQNQIEDIDDQKFVLEKEQELILKNDGIGGEEDGVSAEKLASLAEYYRTRLGAIRVQLSQLERRKKDIKEEMSYLRREISRISRNRNQATHEVVVVFENRMNGAVRLNLSYRVQNAGWVPEYDLRLGDPKQPAQLTLRGQVRNNSGVDWEDVSLTLSTTMPGDDTQAPELSPWAVDIYTPPAPVARRSRQNQLRDVPSAGAASSEARANDDEGFGSSSADDFAFQEAEEAQSASAYTTVSQGLLSLEYSVNLAYDIPADGQPHQVEVQSYDLSLDYEYFAIPKLKEDVFLQALLTDWENYDLLPGLTQIFHEGSYIGETRINPDETNDTLRVSLGKDPMVTVTRERLQDFTTRRKIGSNIREERGYKIVVRNNRDTPIRIRIKDQLPVSRNNDIEINYDEEDLNGGRIVSRYDNIILWELELEPGQNTERRFSFEIKYPKDVQITGL